MSADDAFEALYEVVKATAELPPYPARIYATHRVPYGRVYRMWTTRGDMIVYANRGEIADLPRATGERLGLIGIFGIPVVTE